MGLFLDGDGLAVLIKLHHAEALRILHIVAEHRGALLLLRRPAQMLAQAGAVEDVVAQNHGGPVVADELLAQNKGLGQSVRRRLHLVAQPDAVLTAVAQKALKIGQVGGGGDDEDVPDARKHQGGQGIKDHGLVVHGQKLL